jgi:hypothetical protein
MARDAPIRATARILRRRAFLISPPLRDGLSRVVIALFPFLLLRLVKFEAQVTAGAALSSIWLFLCVNCPKIAWNHEIIHEAL